MARATGFFVERPQVFERAAAAAHDDHVRPTGAAEELDPAADLFHRALALHQRRVEADVQAGKAAGEDVHHVRDGRAARRGDDADAPRKARQRPLALGREQPLGGQLLLELLEGQLQRAQPLRLQQLHQQLVFAAGLVDVDAAARQHRQAVLRLEFPVAVGGAEGHAAHLGVLLLQGEVVMAAGRQLQAGDFARHPDFLERAIEHRADGRVQLRNGEDAPLRRQVEFERELLQGAIVTSKNPDSPPRRRGAEKKRTKTRRLGVSAVNIRRAVYSTPATRNALRAVVLRGMAASSAGANQAKAGPGARAVAARTVKV